MTTESTKMESSAFVHLLAFFCGFLVNAWSAGYAILELGESTGAEFLPISVGILVDHEEHEDNLEIIRRELLQPHVPHQPQSSLSRHRLHQRPFRRRHHRQLLQFRPNPLGKGAHYDPRSRLRGAGRLLADGYDDDDDENGEDEDDDEEEEDDDFIAFHLARTFFNDSYSVSTAICKMLKSGITILIGSHSPGTLNTIKSYSDAFNIPYLTTGPAHNISRRGETFQLFMRPHVVLALRDLIRFKGWKDIHYLYDNEAGLERLQQLMELIQDGLDRVSVETLMLDKKTELVTNLSSIFQSDFLTQGRKRIFLDLSHDLLGAMLLKLGDEVRARSHHFVIVDLIISELDIDDNSAINITGFRILDAQNATTRHYMKNLFRSTTASAAPFNVSSRQRPPIPLQEKHPLLPQRRQQPVQPMSPGRFGFDGGGSDRFRHHYEWNSQIPKLKYETALLVDAVHVVRRALADLRSSKFKGFMGQGYSKLSRSLDCDADVVRPWRYGFQIIRNHLSMTDFYGLTGRVNFDDFGLRRSTHVELMEMTTTRSIAKVGWWDVQTGMFAMDKSYSRTREGERTTMMNKTRIITSILGAPYLMKCEGAKNGNNPNDMFEGYCAELAEKIARLVGFDYVIVPVKDEKFGAQINNTSWNGMIGELIRHEADLVIAPLTITLAREKVVDFSKPFMSLGISIMIKKPVKNDPSVVSFMKPLSNEIWMCVSFAYIGVSVVLFLVGRFSPDEGTVVEPHVGPVEVMTSRDYLSSSDSISSVNILDSHGNLFGRHNVAECRAGFCDLEGAYSAPPLIDDRQIQPIRPIIVHALSADERTTYSPHPIGWRYDGVSCATGASTTADDDLIVVDNKFTIFNSLWFSLGAFMQQGCDIEPRSLSGRIVGSVWWFFTLIIISSYTANLAAFLTVERMHSPIESADDLAKQSEIKYGPVDSGSTKDFFKSSKLPTYQRMWAFMESNDPSTIFVKSNDEGVERVRNSNGKYAFLAESTTLDYYNQRHPCDTMKVGSNLDSKGYGIATPLGSDLKDRITLAVLELLEDGELANLEAKWWQGKGECMKEGIPKKYELASSLKLSNILGIFYILLCGLLLATLLVLCEFLYACKVEANKKKVSFNAVALARLKFSISGSVVSNEPEDLHSMCGENRERFFKVTRKCSET